jgi:hypothetical protein
MESRSFTVPWGSEIFKISQHRTRSISRRFVSAGERESRQGVRHGIDFCSGSLGASGRVGETLHGSNSGGFVVELVNFFFHSINIPDEDESYQRLKVIKEKAAELKVLGRDIYQFDRSMEVLKTAAARA